MSSRKAVRVDKGETDSTYTKCLYSVVAVVVTQGILSQSDTMLSLAYSPVHCSLTLTVPKV